MLNKYEKDFLDRWEAQCDIILYYSQYHQMLPWVGTGRKFRTDFVEPLGRTMIEIQGAVYGLGGHSSGTGITRDALKSLLALPQGWATISIPTTSFDEFLPLAIAAVTSRIP